MDVFIVVMTRSWPSRLDLVAHRLRPQPTWLNAVRIWKASAKKPTWKGAAFWSYWIKHKKTLKYVEIMFSFFSQ